MVMQNYDFEQIKQNVLKWYQNKFSNLSNNFDVELAKNEKDSLIIDMSFENCLAQIVVSNPFFAPYKYLSFEAMTLDSKEAQKNGQPELIYFFYNLSNIKENEIIDELNLGIDFCLNYIPDELKETFIYKKGIIDIYNENVNRVIHYDDLKNIKDILFDGDFICTGTQFQYLVVKNNLVSLRVLPKVFNIKKTK